MPMIIDTWRFVLILSCTAGLSACFASIYWVHRVDRLSEQNKQLHRANERARRERETP